MSFRITKDRIFIDTPTQNDKMGFELHSKHSHRLRSIASFALHIFCCCYGMQRHISFNGKNQSFFAFETFEAKVDGKPVYVKKEDYFKWKKTCDFKDNSFSLDFLSNIELSKITPLKKDPNGQNTPESLLKPQVVDAKPSIVVPDDVKKTPVIPKAEINAAVKDANALVQFFSTKQKANDEDWKMVLSATNNEVFQEAIPLYFGTLKDSPKRFDSATPWIKKVYPRLDETQKDILLNAFEFPEWIAACHPKDEDLTKKVADMLFADIDRVQVFFQKIENWPSKDHRPLIKALIAKLPLTSEKLVLAIAQKTQGGIAFWPTLMEDPHKKFENTATWIKKLYPQLDETQKIILLNTFELPEWIAACYPKDEELRKKVADVLFAYPIQMGLFFQRIDRGDENGPLDDHRPLINALIAKFPQTPEGLDLYRKAQEYQDDNPFWLVLEPNLESLKYGMADILLEELPYETAWVALTSSIQKSVDSKYGIKLFCAAYNAFNEETKPPKQNVLSEKFIEFSLRLFEEVLKVSPEKGERFIDGLTFHWRSINSPFATPVIAFMNSCIIAALRYRSKNPGKILLPFKGTLDWFNLVPTEKEPNPILEANLSIDEKKRYLIWLANHFNRRGVIPKFSDVKNAT